MSKERNWTVLFIGGASGTGKSTLAYQIGKHYGVNILEVDDIYIAIEKVTTKEQFPAVHYWNTGVNWKDVGVDENVNWLVAVSNELAPALKEIADRHIEDNVPVIIEGDFIHPSLTASFNNAQVKSIFVQESSKEHIVQNYVSKRRRGGTAL